MNSSNEELEIHKQHIYYEKFQLICSIQLLEITTWAKCLLFVTGPEEFLVQQTPQETLEKAAVFLITNLSIWDL